jgi:spermidine/putrescine ABC transporter ATP-binding subunit
MQTAIKLKGQSLPVAVEKVSKSFGTYLAVQDVTIQVDAGTIVSLLGPSGCGKTTVLRMVAGLENPDDGAISIGGRVLNDVPVWKRGIGMVFQSYALFPHMSVAENIAFGLRMQGLKGADAQPAVREAMDLTRLGPMADRLPSQLSGGQRQRVALARALANSPQVLLLDEPMGALDKKLRDQMQIELKLLQRRVGISTILVTHDQEEALTLSDQVVVMSNGRVEQAASPEDIYRNPRNIFVADFIGAANLLPGIIISKDDETIQFRLPSGKVVDGKKPGLAELGSSATVMVRPESVRICDVPPAGLNHLTGRISGTLFTGAATIFVVEAEGIDFKVAIPSGEAVVRAVSGEVHLCWDPADTIVVSE